MKRELKWRFQGQRILKMFEDLGMATMNFENPQSLVSYVGSGIPLLPPQLRKYFEEPPIFVNLFYFEDAPLQLLEKPQNYVTTEILKNIGEFARRQRVGDVIVLFNYERPDAVSVMINRDLVEAAKLVFQKYGEYIVLFES